MEGTHIGIGEWREDDRRYRLVVTLDLRVGDLAGDLAERGFKTVEHEPCPPGTLTLSATHDIIDRGKRRGDDFVSGGAGLPALPEHEIMFDAGWSRARYGELRELAERWHLNTMRAACAHQTVVWASDRYGRQAPSLDLTPACPVTGYKYGHAWLVEPLPAEVLAYLDALGVKAPVSA